MQSTEFNKKQTVKYLLFTFGAAYAIQFVVYLLYKSGIPLVYQLVMAGMMFVPLLGVLVSGHSLRGMGWKPVFKGNMKTILFAWLSPAVLTVLGAVIYFLIFPQHFDLSGSYLMEAAGEDALHQLEEAGISYPLYVLVNCIAAITYAPIVNTITALGEEVGWRGFLYPQLKARFGRRTGWLIGGAIWGAWHWPLIWLIGYEYGFDYVGYPFVGMLLFAGVMAALGIIEDRTYEQTGIIWLPALFHGAYNAIATVTLTVCTPATGSASLLGPAPNGLLAGIPTFVLALILFLKSKAPATEKEETV